MFPNANRWKCPKSNTSLMQRRIILIYAVIFLVGVAAAASDEVCQTTACKETATSILNNMDTSYDPCKNFYLFACRNYLMKHNGTTNFVTESNAIINGRLKALLEQPVTPKDIKPFVLAKKFYQSCMIANMEDVDCLQQVKSNLDVATSALYARAYITADVKKSIDDVAKHLRAEFLNIVKQLKWMDNTTKSYALEKINEMHETVAYPKEFFDDTVLENFYSKLAFPKDDNFMGIALMTNLFNRTIPIFNEDYIKKGGKYQWYMGMELSGGKAFYAPSANRMVIPPGILTGSIFNPNWPAYRNYGSIGWIVAHEYSHSVDTRGKKYDKTGEENDWWSPHSQSIYDEKTKCLLNQCTDNHMSSDASRTIGEVIADNLGLILAYNAYQQAIKENPPQQSLPGLEKFDSNQMFWISAANTWCTTYSAEDHAYVFNDDEHLLAKYRVNGPFSNNEHFNEAFKCSATSTMNPAHKCDL